MSEKQMKLMYFASRSSISKEQGTVVYNEVLDLAVVDNPIAARKAIQRDYDKLTAKEKSTVAYNIDGFMVPEFISNNRNAMSQYIAANRVLPSYMENANEWLHG